MSIDDCLNDVAKIEIKNEKRVSVGCIFYIFLTVRAHSNLHVCVSLPSTGAKIQRMIETGLVQIGPNR